MNTSDLPNELYPLTITAYEQHVDYFGVAWTKEFKEPTTIELPPEEGELWIHLRFANGEQLLIDPENRTYRARAVKND